MNRGERQLQHTLGTRQQADAFQTRQILPHLNNRMQSFIGQQTMMFLATADLSGSCDNSFRAGPPGFVRVLDEEHLSWPEYRGNGVMASLGNITESPGVGLLFVDFDEVIGLHVNGTAEIIQDPGYQADTPPGQRARVWIVARVQEAYIHCAKNIPRMVEIPRQRGRRSPAEQSKKSDYFGTVPVSPAGPMPTACAGPGRSE